MSYIFFILYSSGCITVSGDQPGEECIFPFKYEGTQYIACTTAENDGIPWCSTKTDGNNNHVEGKWGNCAAQCLGGAASGSASEGSPAPPQ